MRTASTIVLFLTVGLGGCGSGGTPPEETPIPVVLLGTLALTRGVRTTAEVGDLRMVVGHNVPNGPDLELFDTVVITEADVGRTLVIASVADDPDFVAFVAVLTNGADDTVFARLHFGGGSSARINRESLLIQGADGPLTPDFRGSTITRIELTIDALALETEALPGGGEETSIDATFRFVFFGVRG